MQRKELAECPYCEEESDKDHFYWDRSLRKYICPDCYEILHKK